MRFEAALRRLSEGGARLTNEKFPEFAELPHIFRNGTIVGAEAYAVHRPWLQSRRDRYDPWVLGRIESGASMSAADYIDLLAERRRVIAAVAERTPRVRCDRAADGAADPAALRCARRVSRSRWRSTGSACATP